MKKILIITTYNRPNYFRQTMETWKNVRGFYDGDWNIIISMEPSDFLKEHLDVVAELDHPKVMTSWHNQVLGVLEHPYVAISAAFAYADFVVRAEDDLLVSEDILEYFSWAAENYQDDKDVAAVLAFSTLDGAEQDVIKPARFNPWVWGTWKDRWEEYIGPTWDHDYSTNNGQHMVEAGFDWNLTTRVLPSLGKTCVQPLQSRVQNIGTWGVHGTPENLLQASSFKQSRPQVAYQER